MRVLSRLLHRQTGPHQEIFNRLSDVTMRKIGHFHMKKAWLVNKTLKPIFVRGYRMLSPFFFLPSFLQISPDWRAPLPTHSFLLVLLENPEDPADFHFIALHRRCQVEIEDFHWRLSDFIIEKLLENARENKIPQPVKKREKKEEKNNSGYSAWFSFTSRFSSPPAKPAEVLVDSSSSEPSPSEAQDSPAPLDDQTTPPSSEPSDSSLSPEPILYSNYQIHPECYAIVPSLTLHKLLFALSEEFLFDLREYQILSDNCKIFVKRMAEFFFGLRPAAWEAAM